MKLAVLATGHIAEKVTQTLVQMKELECYAVASRELSKAQEFKRRFGFEKAYGSYQEMVSDPEVELVYITSPHSHHFEHMKLCIEHGKNVICEKAFTVNADQAREINRLAEEHRVFVTEAIWTRYMPSRNIINKVLSDGTIGDIKALTANLCYNVYHRNRVSNPELAGGALLDVGVYCINFALMHLGSDIMDIHSSWQQIDTGVDGMNTMTIRYRDGRLANLTSAITAKSDRQGIFYGTKGYVVITNINNPSCIRVFDYDDNLIRSVEVPPQISGYEYEFIECVKAIEEGRTESWSMPLSDSIEVMGIMDGIRAQWGLRYPME
ncbi:MAG: Gfo/Idh/MocA family oxidoreductase [Spirochaetales bacterium]|nr:Gfo/Idh/MocA family oxidoreductase [Spirochaetales bacterium]